MEMLNLPILPSMCLDDIISKFRNAMDARENECGEVFEVHSHNISDSSSNDYSIEGVHYPKFAFQSETERSTKSNDADDEDSSLDEGKGNPDKYFNALSEAFPTMATDAGLQVQIWLAQNDFDIRDPDLDWTREGPEEEKDAVTEDNQNILRQ